jgi:hypothetical protein
MLLGKYKKRVYRPITAPYLTMYKYIKSRNFATRQCKLQWLTPPSNYSHLPEVGSLELEVFICEVRM